MKFQWGCLDCATVNNATGHFDCHVKLRYDGAGILKCDTCGCRVDLGDRVYKMKLRVQREKRLTFTEFVHDEKTALDAALESNRELRCLLWDLLKNSAIETATMNPVFYECVLYWNRILPTDCDDERADLVLLSSRRIDTRRAK